jgi:hypothetical protein
MGEIVNLRSARKARLRESAAQQAARNRAAAGRTKEEKQAARREAERIARMLDGARRDDD